MKRPMNCLAAMTAGVAVIVTAVAPAAPAESILITPILTREADYSPHCRESTITSRSSIKATPTSRYH